MRVILSLIMVFVFTFAAGGANKLINYNQIDTRGSQSISSLTNASVLKQEHECCHMAESENESQTQRCIGDNLIIAAKVSVVDESYTEVLHCTAIDWHESVVHARDNRPPIA